MTQAGRSKPPAPCYSTLPTTSRCVSGCRRGAADTPPGSGWSRRSERTRGCGSHPRAGRSRSFRPLRFTSSLRREPSPAPVFPPASPPRSGTRPRRTPFWRTAGRCRSHVPGLCTGRAAPAARPRTTAMCAGCRPGRCAAAGSARAALPGRDPRAGRRAGAAPGPFSRGFGPKRPMCAGRARCGDSFAGLARARAGSLDRAAAGRRRPAAMAPRGPIRRSGPPSRFWDPAPGPSSPPPRGSATRPTARRRTRRWPTAQTRRRASGPR